MASSRNSPAGRRPAFARSGSTSLLGKLDDRIEAMRIESEVKARLTLLASASDKPLAEFLRDIYLVLAYGPDEVKRMHRDRVDVVVEMLAGQHVEKFFGRRRT
jgi:hypothetical protein